MPDSNSMSMLPVSLSPTATLHVYVLLLQGLVSSDQQAAVQQYVTAALNKSDRERSELAKDKTGVFTGKQIVIYAFCMLSVTCASINKQQRACLVVSGAVCSSPWD